MIFPKKPQILYAPMLSTFGGGSANGFKASASSGVPTVIFDHQYQYTFSGGQSSATSLGTIGGGLISDFDLEFDVNPDNTGNNPWVLNNGGYQEQNGFLFGIYNPGVAVAGANIGAYGYYGTNSLAFAYQSIKIEVRLSGSTNASRTITSYINGVFNGTSVGGYSETAINWDNMYIGMGRGFNSQNWQQPYDGKIRNIKLTSLD